MLYRIAAFIIGVFLVTTIVQPVLAAGRAGNFGLEVTADKAQYKSGGVTDVYGAVQRVVSVLLALLGIIFFVLTTYAGLRWMTSRGNEEIALEAKNTLESAVIGLVVVVSSYGITSFVFGKLSPVGPVEDNSALPIPVLCADVRNSSNPSDPVRKGDCEAAGCSYSIQLGCQDTVTNPEWCVTLDGGKEVKCERATEAGCGGARSLSDIQMQGAGFICPFSEQTSLITTCPGLAETQCSIIKGCLFVGGDCTVQGGTVGDNNGLTLECNQKMSAEQCAADSNRCTTATSLTSELGCISLEDKRRCTGQQVNQVQDVCDPKNVGCEKVCTNTYDECMIEANKNILQRDIDEDAEECARDKRLCDGKCLALKDACYIEADQAKNVCIDASAGYNY